MSAASRFSLARVLAIFIKEVQQMLRDRPTFAMAVGVPILQLMLFGYAINTDPKGLPTAVVTQDTGAMARSLVAALEQSGYFKIVARPASERDGDSRGHGVVAKQCCGPVEAVEDDIKVAVGVEVRERHAGVDAGDVETPFAGGVGERAVAPVAERDQRRLELREPA